MTRIAVPQEVRELLLRLRAAGFAYREASLAMSRIINCANACPVVSTIMADSCN